MTPFLSQVANDVISRAGGVDRLSNYTFVFPMQRAGLFMKQCLFDAILARKTASSAANTSILLPQFTTIDGLVDSLSELQPDEELQAVLTLYHIYKRHTQTPFSLDLFYGWGRQLLTDFSNIHMALVDADQLIANAADARELEKLDVDEETLQHLRAIFQLPEDTAADSVRKEFSELWSKLPVIFKDYETLQSERHIGSRGARYRWVHQHFDESYVQERLAGRTFVFVGFNYLLKAERELMVRLRDQSLFYWDYDPSFTTNETVYAFIQKQLESLPNALPVSAAKAAAKPVTVIAAPSMSSQAQYVHQWLLEHHHRGQKTAIVIADESLLEPVLYALPSKAKGDDFSANINITKGYPLRSTRVYAEVLKYLKDKANDKQGDETYCDVLERLLQHMKDTLHPLCKEPDEELSSDLQEANLDALNDGKEMREAVLPWNEALVREAYYQTQLVIHHLLNALHEGPSQEGEPSLLDEIRELRTLRLIVRRLLETVSLPFHGQPVTEIQVIGVLETRLLDFDNLLVLNVEEGVLPRVPADNSFIPYYLRKAYGMQTSDEEASIYAYNFFRLLRRPEHVSLLFTDTTAGTSKRSMSRFIMQILTNPSDYVVDADHKKRLTEDNTVAQRPLNPVTTSLLKEKKGKDVVSISPSAINTYLQCPRRFYYGNVLGLREQSDTTAVLPVNDMGSLIHAFVQAAYLLIIGVPEGEKEFAPTKITRDMIQAFLDKPELRDKVIDMAYQELNDDYAKHHLDAANKQPFLREEHLIETKVAEQNMRKVLENDQKQDFYLVSMEHDYRITETVNYHDNQQQKVLLGGKIDRLDIVRDNGRWTLRVLDYKTGRYDAAKLSADTMETIFSGKKDYVLQTLLYCHVISQRQTDLQLPEALLPQGQDTLPIEPCLLYTSKGLESFDPHLWFGSKRTKSAAQIFDYVDWTNGQEMSYQDGLHGVLKSILEDQQFAQCEEGDCKDYCPFFVLCNREKPKTK